MEKNEIQDMITKGRRNLILDTAFIIKVIMQLFNVIETQQNGHKQLN